MMSSHWAHILPLMMTAIGMAAGQERTGVSATGRTAPEPTQTTWLHPRMVDASAFSLSPAVPTTAGPSVPATVFLPCNSDPDGDMPRDVAFLPDGSAAVIVNRDTDNLTFFDVATRTITDTIAVQDFPVDVAVSPDGRYALAPNVFSNTVSVVDLATRTIAGHIPITGTQPFAVAVSSDSSFAVVAVINDGFSSSFSIIDLDALTESRSFLSAPQGVIGFFGDTENGIAGNLFTQFALSPDGSMIVLPDRGGSRVVLYDPSEGSELASIPTAASPTAVDVSSDSSTAVISHENNTQRISEIDLVTRTLTGNFATAALFGQVIRITPDKNFAIAGISNNVIFVDLATGATTATINTGSVGDIEITFDGQYAFVSNFNARIINIATQSLVKTMPFAACVDAAVSPVEHRAVALNNRFRENIHLYNTNGAAGFFEGFALSGAIPEGDATRVMALSPDGRTLVATNNVSRNVSIIDVRTETIRAYVDTGDRPLDAAITPDGNYAVVTSTDTDSVAVIDLSTDTVVADLTVPTRPARVRISPDSTEAYVLTVAGTDRIAFIELDGANSQVTGSLNTGQTGVAFGYPFSENSGIELSADGSILGVCVSFDDQLLLIDTATRTEIDRVPVGDFPIRVAFHPSGTRAYVANAFTNNVSVVEINGANSQVIATVPIGTRPLLVQPDATGAFVYISDQEANGRLHVLGTLLNNIVRIVTLPNGQHARAAHLSPEDDILYVACNGPGGGPHQLVRVDAAGAATSVIDTVDLTSSPVDMAFSEPLRKALVGQPIPDGVDVVRFAVPGDFDGDGVVDLADHAVFADCIAGPDQTPNPSDPEVTPLDCLDVFDADLDSDVDVGDFDPVQDAFGPA